MNQHDWGVLYVEANQQRYTKLKQSNSDNPRVTAINAKRFADPKEYLDADYACGLYSFYRL